MKLCHQNTTITTTINIVNIIIHYIKIILKVQKQILSTYYIKLFIQSFICHSHFVRMSIDLIACAAKACGSRDDRFTDSFVSLVELDIFEAAAEGGLANFSFNNWDVINSINSF